MNKDTNMQIIGNAADEAQFWVYITLAFAAGFLVCHLFA
jgi:hypothetical protein